MTSTMASTAAQSIPTIVIDEAGTKPIANNNLSEALTAIAKAHVEGFTAESTTSSQVKTKAHTTTGSAYFFDGTTDGKKDATIDYSTGVTTAKMPKRVEVEVEDMRHLSPVPSFHSSGYELVNHTTQMHPTQLANTTSPEGIEFIRNAYFPEVQKLIQKVTGAADVRPYIVRSRKQLNQPDWITGRTPQSALPLQHVDFDHLTGPQSIRDEFGEEEGNRLMRTHKRFAQVNVWRAIGTPVERWPLMFVETDGVAGGFDYDTHTRKVYGKNSPRVGLRRPRTHDVILAQDPNFKYRYASKLQVDEALVFSSFDSQPAKVVPHGAFWDNATLDEAPARFSIECRTWCFFDPIEEDEEVEVVAVEEKKAEEEPVPISAMEKLLSVLNAKMLAQLRNMLL